MNNNEPYFIYMGCVSIFETIVFNSPLNAIFLCCIAGLVWCAKEL